VPASAGLPQGPGVPDWVPPATFNERLELAESGIARVKPRAVAIGQSARETFLTTFQTGHGFTSISGGTLTDDSTTINGTQSLRINGPGGAGTTVARSTTLPTVDFTDCLVAAQFRMDGAGSLGGLLLRLASGDITTNYAEVALAPTTDSYLQSGRWETQTLGQSEFTETGTVDWSAINKAELRMTDNGGGALAIRMSYLAARPRLPKGIVSLTFDDGWASQYTAALPVLSKYRMPCTAYIIADLIGTGGYMTETNLVDLRDYHHWDIAPHAATAANHNLASGYGSMANEAAVEAEMDSIIDWCATRGFNTNHWAAPKGQLGGIVRTPAKKKFRFARGTIVGPESMPPRNFAAARGWSVNATSDTLPVLQAAVDKCEADGTWLILCLHKIQGSVSDPVVELLTSTFTSLIDYIATSDVEVRTVFDVLAGSVTD
jgi:hypothetical protein